MNIDPQDMKKQTLAIKNPFVRIAAFIIIAMVVGIGAAWVLLGVCSPILLILLIQHWK